MSKEEKDVELLKAIKEIAEAWKETKEHFGEDFPFEDNLPFKIKEGKKIVEEGEIRFKRKE